MKRVRSLAAVMHGPSITSFTGLPIPVSDLPVSNSVSSHLFCWLLPKRFELVTLEAKVNLQISLVLVVDNSRLVYFFLLSNSSTIPY